MEVGCELHGQPWWPYVESSTALTKIKKLCTNEFTNTRECLLNRRATESEKDSDEFGVCPTRKMMNSEGILLKIEVR